MKPYRLIYWVYMNEVSDEFDSISDAVKFAHYGLLETGQGSPEAIVNADGEVVMDEREIRTMANREFLG